MPGSEDKQKEGATETSHSNARWWEYYAVRYAMGTPIGVLCLYILSVGYPQVSNLLNPSSGFLASATSAISWASAGLTFCYVASTPILLLHTSRMFLFKKNVEQLSRGKLFGLPAAFSIIIAALIWYFGYIKPWESWKCIFGILIYCAIIAVQASLAIRLLVHRKKFFDFYKRLSQARSPERSSEFVESYRHLKEHGNSVLIVLCEILLTWFLWTVRPNQENRFGGVPGMAPVLLLFIWLAPSSMAWFAGAFLEDEFARKEVSVDGEFRPKDSA